MKAGKTLDYYTVDKLFKKMYDRKKFIKKVKYFEKIYYFT